MNLRPFVLFLSKVPPPNLRNKHSCKFEPRKPETQKRMASSKKSTTEEKKSKETKPKNTPKKKNKTTSTTKGNPEKNNNNKVSNGTVSDSSSDVIIIPSSSIESGKDEKQKPNKSSGANERTADTKSKKHKQKKQKRQEEEVNDVVEKEDAKTHRFPMNRIKTILRSQDSDLRITHEALFLVNKATEKFLEEFTKEAHACCVQDHKKSLAYKHLSSVVCKTRSFDFLSDFVPEKLKAKDALAERKIAETENEAA